MATCVNDKRIPPYMNDWLIQLKGKQKDEYSNLSTDDSEGLDEDGAGADVPVVDILQEEKSEDESEDNQPPAKRARLRMSRISVDAQIAEVGRDLLLDLDIDRRSRSMSQLSRSSRASSVVSVASSVISRT